MIWRLALCFALCPAVAPAEVLLNQAEIDKVLLHGPWPHMPATDPSNRVSGNPDAIALGEALFNDPILSVDGAFACASCHDPQGGFTKAEPRAQGRVLLPRNTPALWNVSQHRWFGWGGDSDNLWAASLLPITAPDEMAHTPQSLEAALTESAYAEAYVALFGPVDQDALVNIGKALAAYQETLVTGPTAFDAFRDALERGDLAAAAAYPETAQRGLQIFLGAGNCTFCHSGANFSNGEFHDAGVPYFLSTTEVDPGRFDGLQNLRESPYTLDGPYSDDPEKSGAWAVRNVRQTHSDFGTFRTPSLRNLNATAPYMHNGSLPDLDAVVRHYNEIDLERMHTDGEAILRPLGLSEREIGDLVAFLETLSE